MVVPVGHRRMGSTRVPEYKGKTLARIPAVSLFPGGRQIGSDLQLIANNEGHSA